MPAIAFVTGVPRSGTSALARLLNAHPDIAMMHERYGGAVARPDFGPGHFAAERVRTYHEEDGSRRAFDHANTQAALVKWETAAVVGDKIPNPRRVLRAISRFENAKVIAIIRDPFSVALSYQARVLKAQTNWPQHRDFQAAVREHNEGMAALLEAQRRNKGNLLVVRYDHVFSPEADLSPIFNFLGVSAEVGARAALHEQELKDDEHRLRGRIATHVSANADFAPYRALLKTCALNGQEGSPETTPSSITETSRGSLNLRRFVPPFLRRTLDKTAR